MIALRPTVFALALAAALSLAPARATLAQEAGDKDTAAKHALIRDLLSKYDDAVWRANSESGEARVARLKAAASLLELATGIAQSLPRPAPAEAPPPPPPAAPAPVEAARHPEVIRELLGTATALEQRGADERTALHDRDRYRQEAKALRDRAMRLLEGAEGGKGGGDGRLAAEVKELRAQVQELRALVEKLAAALGEKKPAAEPR